MRTIIIFIGLTALLNLCFPLCEFNRLLPGFMFTCSHTETEIQRISLISFTLQWILPAIAVAIFMWQTKIANSLYLESNTRLFNISVYIYLVFCGLRFTKSFITMYTNIYAFHELYTLKIFLDFLALPLKILLLCGVVKLFMNLKPYKSP